MASVTRKLQRLEAKAAGIPELEREITRLKDELGDVRAGWRDERKALRAEIELERLQRVSAQRGLVAYMQEQGLADHIGYDPDKDPAVLKEIKAGRIPALQTHPTVRQILEIEQREQQRTLVS